uniref:Uncharacterized protein n=1 Tax=Rhizophora mucronata TaxID=61149 RepID=A0A2P2R3W7_RHIMU
MWRPCALECPFFRTNKLMDQKNTSKHVTKQKEVTTHFRCSLDIMIQYVFAKTIMIENQKDCKININKH